MRYLNTPIGLKLITLLSIIIIITQAEDIEDLESPEDDDSLVPPPLSMVEDSLADSDFDVYPARSARRDDGSCFTIYSFQLTKRRGTFQQARAMCKENGGELIHENFGFAGKKSELFYAIYQVVKAKKYGWVGLERKSHRWQFVDGSAYNPQLKVKQLFHWGPKGPSKNGGKCVIERRESKTLKNVDCNREYYGVCENKRTVCLEN